MVARTVIDRFPQSLADSWQKVSSHRNVNFPLTTKHSCIVLQDIDDPPLKEESHIDEVEIYIKLYIPKIYSVFL